MKNKLLLTIKALSDMNRLRIFFALGAYEELCACQIIAMLKLSGASVSRHLSILVDADLVQNRKAGRWIFFRLNRENPMLESWLTFLKTQTKTMAIFSEDLEYLQISKAQDVLETCNRRGN
jgi:DNA-binding transcriptional ArsR family regulator